MKLLQTRAYIFGLIAAGVLLPVQANATNHVSVPEPVSLTLLAVGAAGLGAAALIRRRKDK